MKSADGRKTQRERVTINACSNASGTIKLPLLLIGKAKNPCCFKNVSRDRLPIVYANQSNAWVNAALFTDWFHKNFVPTVQGKLREIGCESKAVLLLDNCSAHPDEELISADGKVIVKFLPPNVTSLIQPMDQGVLVAIKRRYRRKILEELVFQDNHGTSVVNFLRGIHLLKVSEMITASWNEIQPKTLRLTWRKIFPLEDDDDNNQESHVCAPTVEEFHSFFKVLGQEIDENEVGEWLQTDSGDRGYEHLSDAEIIVGVSSELTQDVSDDEGDSAIEPFGDSSCASVSISHGEAVKMFDSCITWLQLQEEASPHNPSVLRDLREIAANKRLSSLNQTKLTDYFPV